MSHSNSSLNTFASCMAKYEHNYILHSPKCLPESPHLLFGAMAHEVLEKAGNLRDEAVGQYEITNNQYIAHSIPSEVLYSDLKEYFKINSWQQYFLPIIAQVKEYEDTLVNELAETSDEPVLIQRELKWSFSSDELTSFGITGISQPLVGIIDLLLLTNNKAIIIDYKFSSKQKTQDNFDMDSQLPLYALFVHLYYKIPLHNIQYGYIDIPKQMFSRPALLSNGTLSRSKSQNVSQDMYKKCVIAVHGDDPYYNCDEGGYYYEAYLSFAHNKCAYLSMQYLDFDVYANVTKDLINTAKMIDFMTENKMPFLRRYDAYTCASCEYKEACKPWLTVGDKQ